jgi:DNA-binding response OmpR family regulator
MDQTKVLIVDDDPGCRLLLADLLCGEPYRVLEASSGPAAMAIVRHELPDLILLDVRMPAQDGLAVLRELKQQDRTRHIPVIMVTALAEDSDVTQCLDAGAVDHVAKPFVASVVRARVRAALRNRPSTESRVPKRGKLIGFIGAKGGVGTTTVAVNAALALQALGRSVVVVELRPYVGTVAQQLGVTSARNIQPLLDQDHTVASNSQLLMKCLTPHRTGLHLLLAPPTMDGERELTPLQTHSILNALSAMADFVIVDLPCLPSKATRVALQCCDFVGLTIALEPSCLALAPVMFAALASWGVGGNAVGAVLVFHESGTDSPSTVQLARTQLHCRIVSVIPPAADFCLVALKSGEPLVLGMPESIEALAFNHLAARLVMDPIPALTV